MSIEVNGLPATHVWCQNCDQVTSARVEPLSELDTSKKYFGGDVICGRCALVITSLYRRAELPSGV